MHVCVHVCVCVCMYVCICVTGSEKNGINFVLKIKNRKQKKISKYCFSEFLASPLKCLPYILSDRFTSHSRLKFLICRSSGVI